LTHKEHHTKENIDLCVRNFERAAKNASHFTTNSHHTADDLIKYFSVQEDRITVVECGIPLNFFHPASDDRKHEIRHQFNLPDRYFLYVGSLEPRKNLVTLLKAMSQYKGAEKLVVAGASGWKNNAIMNKMFSNDRCIFLDYVPDDALPGLYSAALAFIYPSLYEGFGFPVVEAMACGTPVITSNNSSLKEIAEGAAILIDNPEDDKVILQELQRIADDQRLRGNLFSLGIDRVKKYGIDSMATKMISLYKRLIEYTQ
jgi:glycosyltransferase involved in cell wall biosynthesis